jgi:hypothetical protein
LVAGPSLGQVTVFALGGSSDGSCETLTLSANGSATKWRAIKSYLEEEDLTVAELNDL